MKRAELLGWLESHAKNFATDLAHLANLLELAQDAAPDHLRHDLHALHTDLVAGVVLLRRVADRARTLAVVVGLE